jgi:hypothetical protein
VTERIEKIRDGGNVMIYPNFQYALISPGTAMPGWPQPQRPIRVPFPGQPTPVRVDAHQWVKDVLEQWAARRRRFPGRRDPSRHRDRRA